MAYALKYTTYKQFPNGDKYTLNIYQKDYNGSPLEIAVLTGFNLQIQGDQSALTAPIIKTSVNISLKDTLVENAQGQMVSVLGGKKYGQWEEFYTNDPVKYRVDVVYSGGLTRNATIWSGFLTPDSWGEEMVYGGDINLTARDMLGYLDEQEFDLTGRVTIQNLIEAAITKSKASMSSVSFKTAECLYNSNGQSILAATIGASTYSGNTWYQALEKVLESLGLVLRYDGNGGWLVTSLRYLASHTHETHTPCFTNRSGYRTLDPAVKQIVETFDPKWENFDVPDAEADKVSQASGTWTCEYHWVTTRTASVQKYQITGDANWNGYAASLPNRTPYKNALKRNIYIPVNTTTDVGLVFRRTGFLPPCRVVLGISAPHHATASTIINDGDNINPAATRSIEAIISVVVDGTTYYLNSEYRWDSQSSHTIEITPDAASIEIPAIGGGSASDFRITFNKANMDDYVGAVSAPFYVAVDVQFQPLDGASEIAGEYKTTTIYNENNHNEITRTPSIGAASGSANIDFINNLLAYGNGFATDAWKFSGDANTFPLAVMIHAQLLVYNGQMEDSQGNTTGNSIFTGNLHDYTRVPAAPCTKYTYFGRNCILLSGAYNFLTGEVDSVTLREVFGWSDVWDTFNPSYSVKTSKNEGGTSSAGGSGGSSSGGGGTGGVTSVDVSVPTGLIATGNPITSRGTIAIAYDPDWSGNPHNTTFAQLGSKPTTLSGYGITDAYTKAEVNGKLITAVNLTTSKLTLTRSDGNLETSIPTWNQNTTGNAATATEASLALKIYGRYTSNGGQQNPDYFGKNRVGFLMMNTTVNGNSYFKDWMVMDCYAGNDAGGAVAIGVNRQALGAYIMRSYSERTSWAESAELYGTHNCNNTSTAWSASSLTLNGAISGVTNINSVIHLSTNAVDVSTFCDSVPAQGSLASVAHASFGVKGYYGMYFYTTGDGEGHIQQGRADGTATSYDLILQEKGGKVGIGTTSPSEKLYVSGNIATTGNIICTANTQTIGTSAKPWGAFYGNKWYPNANDTTNYIEYTNGGFLIHGNVAATGEVAAGA